MPTARLSAGVQRVRWVSVVQEEYSLCCSDRCYGLREGSLRPGSAQGQGLREGSRRRPRIGDPHRSRRRYRSDRDRRRYSAAAQRLPSAQPPPRLISGPTPPERSVDGHTGGVSGSGVFLSGGFLPGYSPAAATGGLAAFPTLQAECRRHSKTEARPSLKQI